MELDDWEKMEADEVEMQKLQMKAIEYGSELMREYGHDRDRSQYRRMLEDIFSLIAYDDAKSSIHGHLLDRAGRVTVAEELNSAILGRNTYLRALHLLTFNDSFAWSLIVCSIRTALPPNRGTFGRVCQGWGSSHIRQPEKHVTGRRRLLLITTSRPLF